MSNNSLLSDVKKMTEKWPSHLVARSEVDRFSGFSISGKSLANLESRGDSVPEKISVGGKVAYRADELACWILSRKTKKAS